MADILSQELVLAVDQEPFEANSNWFTILYPLVTIYGERIEANVAAFPNRGRVWYMVQSPGLRRQMGPGTLWHGMVEETTAFKTYDPDRDRYQISLRHAFAPGAPQFFEIIDQHFTEPDVRIVRQERLIRLARRPLSDVFLRGRDTVLGPFHAVWQDGELRLEPREGTALRIPRADFEAMVRIESFVHEANQYDRHRAAMLFNYHLVHKNDLNWEELRRRGEAVDVRPDREILNQTVQQLRFSRSEKQELKRLLERLQEVSLSEDLRERVRDVKLDIGQGLDNADALARVIGEMPQFKEFLEHHIETVTSARIQEQVTVRQITVQNELHGLEAKKQKVEADLARLRQTYDERVARQDEELRQRFDERVASIEQRERDLESRERAFDERERSQTAQVERLLKQYEEKGAQIAEELFLRMPIFRAMGAGMGLGPGAATARADQAPRRRQLHLPPFLKTAKDFAHDIGEKEFVDQFRDVVGQRGFAYSDLDLVNFHVCMKTGMLTILAGQSGSGKSSLPRLYAEALGCREEYLHIPVQPNWFDEREVLGSVNPLAGFYDPSPVGLVERLIAADEDASRQRGGLYVICFDEMNLARIEHYFAQFLSVMEHPAEERALRLFNRTAVAEDDPYRSYDLVPLHPNTRFVGTINVDETTHFLSAKVLDRAQFITLQVPTLGRATAVSTVSSLPGITPVPAETYNAWAAPRQVAPEVVEFLRDLDDALRLSNQGLGFRRFEQIRQYVAGAAGLMNQDESLDYAMRQVVLPRLRKNAYRFEDMLKRLQVLLKADRFPGSSSLLERIAATESDYEFFQLL
ncbi:MAG: AAA domain-containing protein [Lentisphaerae bacterium]|nr:AAA domain-containing protein [Lentisphaerota bacterium]